MCERRLSILTSEADRLRVTVPSSFIGVDVRGELSPLPLVCLPLLLRGYTPLSVGRWVFVTCYETQDEQIDFCTAYQVSPKLDYLHL